MIPFEVINRSKKTAVIDPVEKIFTPKLIKTVFSKTAGYTETTRHILEVIASSKPAAYHVNRTLIEFGEEICGEINEEMYGNLLAAIETQIGFGKGIFTSTLMHMPERYARVKLAQWKKDEGSLAAINTSLRQSMLVHAISQKKNNLAHDLYIWMDQIGEAFDAKLSLTFMERGQIEQANLGAVFPEELHVDLLCKSHQAYMQALQIATTARSEEIVRQSMAKELGATSSTWRGLMECLNKKLANTDYDSETVLNRFRAIGSVLIDYVRRMDKETRKKELVDDDLRMMAFRLGVKDVVVEMQSSKHKSRALAEDLCL